ncbi:MAG: hypothetical protein ABW250_00115 [Pyrinomonadaceae bacterium]
MSQVTNRREFIKVTTLTAAGAWVAGRKHRGCRHVVGLGRAGRHSRVVREG